MWLCCAFLEGLMAERDETWVWWLQQLAEYRQDGRDDAERGEFSWPYPFNNACITERLGIASRFTLK